MIHLMDIIAHAVTRYVIREPYISNIFQKHFNFFLNTQPTILSAATFKTFLSFPTPIIDK